MKKFLIFTAATVAFAFAACAALPTYKTVSAYGNASAGATANFVDDPNSQIRIIYVNWGADTNNNAISFTTGTTAFSIMATNQASTSVTNQINSTNGLAVGSTLMLNHGGTLYSATVAAWNSSTNSGVYNLTNVVLNGSGWSVATSVGDSVYLMSSATSWPLGVGTNTITGDAVFVGNYGRPVVVSLSTPLVTNKLYAVSAHYDSASQ